MANLRTFKKDVYYFMDEVVTNCYACIYFGKKSSEGILAIADEAYSTCETMIQKANHPADKKNRALVKKHYSFLRKELMDKTSEFYEKLSEECKKAE